jgi:hypothetical protein
LRRPIENSPQLKKTPTGEMNSIQKNAKKLIINQSSNIQRLFQGPPLNLSKNYVQLLLLISFTLFYSTLVPAIGLLAPFGILLIYISTKV